MLSVSRNWTLNICYRQICIGKTVILIMMKDGEMYYILWLKGFDFIYKFMYVCDGRIEVTTTSYFSPFQTGKMLVLYLSIIYFKKRKKEKWTEDVFGLSMWWWDGLKARADETRMREINSRVKFHWVRLTWKFRIFYFFSFFLNRIGPKQCDESISLDIVSCKIEFSASFLLFLFFPYFFVQTLF